MSTLGILGIIGTFAFGIAYAWSQYRMGQTKSMADQTENQINALKLLNEQLDAYKLVIEENNKRFQSYDNKFAEMQKRIEVQEAIGIEKDKKLAEYVQILQNKNPQMDEFMKLGMEAARESKEFMEKNLKMMDELKGEIKDTRRMIMGALANNHVTVVTNPTQITDRRKAEIVEPNVADGKNE